MQVTCMSCGHIGADGDPNNKVVKRFYTCHVCREKGQVNYMLPCSNGRILDEYKGHTNEMCSAYNKQKEIK